MVCARSTSATKTSNAVRLSRPLWCHKRRERSRIVGRSLYRIQNVRASNRSHGVQCYAPRQSAPGCKEARIGRLDYCKNPRFSVRGMKVAFHSVVPAGFGGHECPPAAAVFAVPTTRPANARAALLSEEQLMKKSTTCQPAQLISNVSLAVSPSAAGTEPLKPRLTL